MQQTVNVRKVDWGKATLPVVNYAIIEAARYIGVPPWELLEHPEWIRPAWQAAKIVRGEMEPPSIEAEEEAIVTYTDGVISRDRRMAQGAGDVPSGFD